MRFLARMKNYSRKFHWEITAEISRNTRIDPWRRFKPAIFITKQCTFLSCPIVIAHHVSFAEDEIFSPKKLAFSTENNAILLQKLITILLVKKRDFFWPNICKNRRK
jgi:hypothetical protein